MIENEEWQAAYREVLAAQRARDGEPPTVDEIEACYAGRLSNEEAARVRERLAYYPELARVMTASFPDDADDVLSDIEVEHDWKALHRDIGASRRVWQAIAVAASLAIVAGVYFWRNSGPGLPGNQVVARVMIPDGHRGGRELPILLSTGDRFDLKLALPANSADGEYRVQIDVIDPPPRREVWRKPRLTREANNSLSISVDGSVLSPGSYVISVYQMGRAEPVSRYTATVSQP